MKLSLARRLFAGHRLISNRDEKLIREFYLGMLQESFPKEAADTISSSFRKHLFEVSCIIATVRERGESSVSLVDVGGGLGINAIILKHLFGYKCTVIDRLNEFSAMHQRIVGNEKQLIERLKNFNVEIIKRDFFKEGFPFKSVKFDVATCFSVIEHLPYSPKKLIYNIADIIKPLGIFILGTPNQLHFNNRIKAVLGKNIWEDFEYYYGAVPFYGHVREFLPGELEKLIKREKSFNLLKIIYSSYPVSDRIDLLQSKIGQFPSMLLTMLINGIVNIFPKKLHYDMIAIAEKKNMEI